MRRLALLALLFVCVVSEPSQGGAPPAAAPGLLASYTDGAHHIMTVAATPHFVLKAEESIHPQVLPGFTAQWTGSLKIVKRAKYTFTADGGSGAKILIDGADAGGKAVELELGDHAINISVSRIAAAGASRLQVIWSADFFAAEPLPASVLFHVGEPPEVSQQARIEAGQLLVEELNCVACHRSGFKSLTPHVAPDLSTVGTRLHPAWIAKWLEDPRAFRATTAMPHVTLKADERRDIAAYLATLKNPSNKVKEPQRSTSRMEAGKQLVETIGCTACHGGAKGNSLEGLGSKWLPGQLADYLLNPSTVDHSGRMPAMMLQKDEALAIAAYLVESKKVEFEEKIAGGSAKRGEQLVQSQGCVSCHAVRPAQAKPLASSGAAAVALESLDQPGRGCLAEHPTAPAMDYGLTPQKIELIAAFITSIKAQPMATAAPVYEFYHRTKSFGCINCHELNDSVPADSTERVPQLTNVGGRLRKQWISEVLTQGKRVRPWLKRRMPNFGGSSGVADLPACAVAASGAGEAGSLPSPTRDEIAAGQKLLGNGAGGFGCITCHGFGGAKPNVIDDTRGPDITTVAQRLRPDHFRRWVLDPKRVSPSTPMPSFFDGAPAAEAAAKVETMFRYVAMGENMPPPIGWVDKNNYAIAVHDEPVVIRAVLPNVDGGAKIPRGIAVGLPGLINYCFDADTCTLRYAWTGGFLDMQPSWAGRGGNMVRVQGMRFYTNSIASLRIGESEVQPAAEFLGYSIVDGKPQFHYRLGDVEVHELIAAPEKALGLVRRFELDSGGKPVTFSVVDQPGVTYTAEGGELQAAPVKDGTNKVPGQVLKFTGGKIKFSVTLTVKEAK